MSRNRKWYPAKPPKPPVGNLTDADMVGPSEFTHSGVTLVLNWSGVGFTNGKIKPGFKAKLKGYQDWETVGTGHLKNGGVSTDMYPQDDYWWTKDLPTVKEALEFICEHCKKEQMVACAERDARYAAQAAEAGK